MDELFFEYFEQPDDLNENFLSSSIISLDASAMLDLLRFPFESAESYIKLLDKVKDRLHITYQAALEYSRNHKKVQITQSNNYKNAIKDIEKELSNSEEKIQSVFKEKHKHPFIEEKYFKSLANSRQTIIEQLETAQNKYSESSRSLNTKLIELMKKRITEDFDDQELIDIYNKGKTRYESKIPPGYLDFKKEAAEQPESKRRAFGDLIIWEQLKDLSIREKNNVVFITSDVKEDWFLRIKGKTIGPRPELRKEFHEETNFHFIAYTPQQFVEIFSKNLSLTVSPKVLKDMLAFEKTYANEDDHIDICPRCGSSEIVYDGDYEGPNEPPSQFIYCVNCGLDLTYFA